MKQKIRLTISELPKSIKKGILFIRNNENDYIDIIEVIWPGKHTNELYVAPLNAEYSAPRFINPQMYGFNFQFVFLAVFTNLQNKAQIKMDAHFILGAFDEFDWGNFIHSLKANTNIPEKVEARWEKETPYTLGSDVFIFNYKHANICFSDETIIPLPDWNDLTGFSSGLSFPSYDGKDIIVKIPREAFFTFDLDKHVALIAQPNIKIMKLINTFMPEKISDDINWPEMIRTYQYFRFILRHF